MSSKILKEQAGLPPFKHRLDDKIALVTGGGSGLGAAIARRLDAEGAKVIITDIDLDTAQSQANELTNLSHAIAHDVSSEKNWEEVVTLLTKQYGHLDILVNNAGITTMGSIESLSLADLRHEFDVDVGGVFLGCQKCLPLLKVNGGSIINMSSAAGIKPDPQLVGYNAVKAAVTLMTKSIALHCAKEGYGIRCNSVHPGAIHTPIIDKVLSQVDNPEETLAGFVSVHPIGHLGHPDDIASIVAYLASNESRFATGAAFSIDGGMTAL